MSGNDVPQSDGAIARWDAALVCDGYCIIPRAIEPDVIARLDADLGVRFAATPFCEGGFYGARTKRFGSLLKRSTVAERLVRHPLVLALAERRLLPWCDRINLNLTQAVEIHSGALAQLPHRDQDMWAGPKGTLEYLVNVMWPLTAFTGENGATVLWPGSHRRQGEAMLPNEDAVAAAMTPGDALLFLGSTLHGVRCQPHASAAARGDRQLLPRLAETLREPVAGLPAARGAPLRS